MGVKYIQYKVAECDICGTEKQFEAIYNMPNDWNEIEDSCGLIRYGCVCYECSKRIKGYIEEFKSLHHKKAEEKL
jgi:hypothetical protein